jgi:hypothetical protein
MPRLLARNGCSGGNCPAVYDSDPDIPEGHLAVVGDRLADGLANRLADSTADHEVGLTISRDLIAAALRPAPRPVSGTDLQAQFDGFRYTAFRLETLQDYAGATGRDDEWVAHIRTASRWQKRHQRVHVVTQPLSAGMQQELTEGYEGNVAAGEDIRIIGVQQGDWPDGIPHQDFWLFDSQRLFVQQYDEAGKYIGVLQAEDPGQILSACHVRDAALHRAMPWRAYIGSRLELQTRLAQ